MLKESAILNCGFTSDPTTSPNLTKWLHCLSCASATPCAWRMCKKSRVSAYDLLPCSSHHGTFKYCCLSPNWLPADCLQMQKARLLIPTSWHKKQLNQQKFLIIGQGTRLIYMAPVGTQCIEYTMWIASFSVWPITRKCYLAQQWLLDAALLTTPCIPLLLLSYSGWSQKG